MYSLHGHCRTSNPKAFDPCPIAAPTLFLQPFVFIISVSKKRGQAAWHGNSRDSASHDCHTRFGHDMIWGQPSGSWHQEFCHFITFILKVLRTHQVIHQFYCTFNPRKTSTGLLTWPWCCSGAIWVISIPIFFYANQEINEHIQKQGNGGKDYGRSSARVAMNSMNRRWSMIFWKMGHRVSKPRNYISSLLNLSVQVVQLRISQDITEKNVPESQGLQTV